MNYEGKLFIDDGIDAYKEYGVFVEQYGYKELIQMPSFKKLDVTEWPEYNGQEVDLMSPVLGSRNLQIQFNIVNVRLAEDFFLALSNNAYHYFRFTDLKRTYRLRMISNGSFSQLVRVGKFTLTFSDDFPQVPNTPHYKLGETEVKQTGYELDGIDFAQFGSYLLKGTDTSIRKSANIRTALTIDITSSTGVVYDDKAVKFNAKDVTLKMLINAETIDEFWKRWYSLFSVLLQPESRIFYFAALGIEYECYYKSNQVSKFDILRNGHVWCEFSIVLTFTSWNPL